MISCSELCGSDYGERAQSTDHNSHQHYGVRSYLHHFYEECTASIWDQDEDFQIHSSPSRWSTVLWKVCLTFGALILIVGLTVLTVGFATSPKIEAFGEEELLFIDRHAMHFNRALEICKLVGGVLFCTGGILAAVGLLLSSFIRGNPNEESYLQQRFKEKLAELQATVHPIMQAPREKWKIPTTLSKVQNVQPVSKT